MFAFLLCLHGLVFEIVEVQVHVDGIVGIEGNAFVLQKALHKVWVSEVMLTGECAESIDNAMRRHICPDALAERVADHSRRKSRADFFCDRAIS